jgi:hypothetical protein
VTTKLPITTGTDYPLLVLRDAAALAHRARMRLLGKRDSGFNAFAASIAALREVP